LYFGHLYGLVVGLTVGGYAISRRVIFFVVVGLMLSVLGSGGVWRRLEGRKHDITNFLNILTIVIIVLPIIGVAQFWLQTSSKSREFKTQQAATNEPAIRLSGSYQPDIYYIILDGYARADVLQEIYGYDNEELVQFLEERGFYVAAHSQSNYIHTFLSLASALNLSYLNEWVAPVQGSSDRTPLTELIRHSKVRRALEAAGYQTIAFSTGVLLSEMPDADLYLSRYDDAISDFERLLLSTSAVQIPVELFDLDTPVRGYHAFRERVLFAFEQLRQLSDATGPKFVFAHVLAPHPPFVFDRDGAPIQPDRPFFLGDAGGYRGDTEEYLVGYANQLAYINQLLMETIDGILANSEEQPIIILQGDHGPGALFSWESADDSCLWERFSIFNAYYLPQDAAVHMYDTITPVNTFRVVFDTTFGTQLGRLTDETFYSTWNQPYDLIKVSDKSQERCDLP
jgi:hypothetical protein